MEKIEVKKTLVDISKLNKEKLKDVVREQSVLIDELKNINESMSKSLACYRHILLSELRGETVMNDFEDEEPDMIQIQAHPLLRIREIKIPLEQRDDKGDESKSMSYA